MILALDTSAAISVALVDGLDVVAAESVFEPRGHAELLAAMIERVMAAAGATRDDITEVVVGTGPGPFTGLRVGLVTARTLAFAWGVPLSGVCSLDAFGVTHQGEFTAIADARRKEVYWATYANGVRVEGPLVTKPADVRLVGTAVGRGAALYPEVFPDAAPGDPDPAALAFAVQAWRAAGETDFPSEPLYLRRPDVHGVPTG